MGSSIRQCEGADKRPRNDREISLNIVQAIEIRTGLEQGSKGVGDAGDDIRCQAMTLSDTVCTAVHLQPCYSPTLASLYLAPIFVQCVPACLFIYSDSICSVPLSDTTVSTTTGSCQALFGQNREGNHQLARIALVRFASAEKPTTNTDSSDGEKKRKRATSGGIYLEH